MSTGQTPVWRSLNCESPPDFRFQLTQLSYTHHCSCILLHGAAASCFALSGHWWAMPTLPTAIIITGFRCATKPRNNSSSNLVTRPFDLYGAPGRIRTCDPRLSLPTTPFDAPWYMGLWSGLSLHHFRCRTYSLYGSPMQPVTQVSSGLPSA